MEKVEVDVIIVGAGVVGLAAAWKIASQTNKSVVVIERNEKFGQETSSRNSEVIHSGFYYPPDMLKSRLCVSGNPMLYEYCAQKKITHSKCGKILLARNWAEEQQLDILFQHALLNDVAVTRLTETGIRGMEPDISGCSGLYFPNTGFLNAHELMQRLFFEGQQAGAIYLFGTTVIGALYNGLDYEIATQRERIYAQQVINCGGLGAENIAGLIGIDTKKSGYELHLCKGEYFKIRGMQKIHHLIYSVPTPNSLGIHLSRDSGGNWRLGPNAFYVDDLDYTVDEKHGDEFFQAARAYLPLLRSDDLTPDFAGIRPKLQGPGEKTQDFIIRDESDKGFPGWINLIGIESPGLTASLAIGDYLIEMVKMGTPSSIGNGTVLLG